MARILMLLDHAYPSDLRVENEMASLVQAGFDVTLLAIGPDDRTPRESIGGVRLIRDNISAGRRNRMRGLAGSIPIIRRYVGRRVQEIYRTWPFDALHAHDLYLLGAALTAGKQLGVKVVADLHENWVAALEYYAWSNRYPAKWFNNLRRWDKLESRWTKSADGVIVVIDEMRDRLVDRGLLEEKILVLPNTVRRDSFDAYGIDEAVAASIRSALTLLYVGGMDVHRGIETAIRAMPEILFRVPDARLVLVGDGALRKQLQSLTESLGLTGSIHFLGKQPQERVPSYIAGADVGLIPHLKTGHTDHTIPHKLFHYMHMGLPVVSSNCRPIERILNETGCGISYPSGNASELALSVLKLAESAALQLETGDNGRRAVEDVYNWTSTSVGFAKFYDDILS